MVIYSQFIENLMVACKYPQEALLELKRTFMKIEENERVKRLLLSVKNKHGDYPVFDAFTKAALYTSAKLLGTGRYTMYLICLLMYTEQLYEKYKLLKLDEELYFNTMSDLTNKLRECIEVKGQVGTFVPSWLAGYFKLQRIAIGRFQFEISEFKEMDIYSFPCGKVMKRGDRYIQMHIPSSGIPLTEEVRLESYKKAYEFFKMLFGGQDVVFGCISWLLYPKNREILPASMNIRGFMEDFVIIKELSFPVFIDSWRIFGSQYKLNSKKLPRNTTLQKAYAQLLENGEKTGEGFGFFLFDGENIIH